MHNLMTHYKIIIIYDAQQLLPSPYNDELVNLYTCIIIYNYSTYSLSVII